MVSWDALEIVGLHYVVEVDVFRATLLGLEGGVLPLF